MRSFTKHLFGPVSNGSRLTEETSVPRVHLCTFRLCLHAPVTIYVHLERSALIATMHPRDTRNNESRLHKRVREFVVCRKIIKKKTGIFWTHTRAHPCVGITGNSTECDSWNCKKNLDVNKWNYRYSVIAPAYLFSCLCVLFFFFFFVWNHVFGD